ncbi:MAG: rhamnan synthesis F family protein [Alphaproteobacteria bacterium]
MNISGGALKFANGLRRIGYSQADEVLNAVAPLRPRVLEVVAGNVAPGASRHLCVFAHYDPHGRIDDYVLHHLRALARAGRETVLVSTAPGLDAESLEKAKAWCRAIIVRENRGHDFGSWKAGLRHAGPVESYETLTLANDSVYGPLRPLDEVFSRIASRNLDVWGITDSLEYGYHLQSYFLVFSNRVLRSAEFLRFWERLPAYRFRQSVIRKGEIGLSRRLQAAGFRLGALCEYEEMTRRHRAAVTAAEKTSILGGRTNASLVHWRLLIEREACPYLKVGLLRDNRLRARDVERWLEVLRGCSGYDPGLIERHLARVRLDR